MSQIIASIIGSIGFSIVFGIRRAYMLPIAVNAGLSWAVYLLVNGFAGDFAANMVSAMFCSLSSFNFFLFFITFFITCQIQK